MTDLNASVATLSRLDGNPGAVVVGRITKWGNPYDVDEVGRDLAVRLFRWLVGLLTRSYRMAVGSSSRGKILLCWCKPQSFATVIRLLELANQ